MPPCTCKKVGSQACETKFNHICVCPKTCLSDIHFCICDEKEEHIEKCRNDSHICVCIHGNGCRCVLNYHICVCQKMGAELCMLNAHSDKHLCICQDDHEKCLAQKDHTCICSKVGPSMCKMTSENQYDDVHSCSCLNFGPKTCKAKYEHKCTKEVTESRFLYRGKNGGTVVFCKSDRCKDYREKFTCHEIPFPIDNLKALPLELIVKITGAIQDI